MDSTNSNPADPAPLSPDDAAARALNKRYEGLVTVRTKAIKGKGAWYWAHLEPVLVRNTTTNLPKAVKLKCLLCDAVFSASNPSENLKRNTCLNFTFVLRPILSAALVTGEVVDVEDERGWRWGRRLKRLAFQFGFSRLASPGPRLTLASLTWLASPSPGRSLGDESPGCNDLPKIEAAWLCL
ncbi:hypothetical protein ACLB2K_002217 [Fragaria x ananassa]